MRPTSRIFRYPRRARDVVQGSLLKLWRDPALRLLPDPPNRPDTVRAEHGFQDLIPEGDVDHNYGSARSRVGDDSPRMADAPWGGLLGCLAPAERQAIALALQGGCSSFDVASLLGEAEEIVRARMRSGLDRLRIIVDPSSIAGRADG